ncbi:hypothetical protein EDD37DRAFT_618501 [Exophiala viscosa]|uniref:uncharacterized protein n=1 Tax=Exophiala viscosa TaxID=2486360 RepID=UPI00219BF6BF|nr:hypothetical protein EDD37DRAFT_618501 [Exophiala viscosa]
MPHLPSLCIMLLSSFFGRYLGTLPTESGLKALPILCRRLPFRSTTPYNHHNMAPGKRSARSFTPRAAQPARRRAQGPPRPHRPNRHVARCRFCASEFDDNSSVYRHCQSHHQDVPEVAAVLAAGRKSDRNWAVPIGTPANNAGGAVHAPAQHQQQQQQQQQQAAAVAADHGNDVVDEPVNGNDDQYQGLSGTQQPPQQQQDNDDAEDDAACMTYTYPDPEECHTGVYRPREGR